MVKSGRRRWIRRSIVAAVVVVAALVAVKVSIQWRDRSDEVNIDDLAASFDPKAEAQSGSSTLAVGVWSYNATGNEFIDILGGPLHTFPDVVAQTVSNTSCGQNITVHLFEQRYDSIDLCHDDKGQLVLERFATRHEFVGVADLTTTEQCEPFRVWWPSIAKDVGHRSSVTCTAKSDMSGVVPATVYYEVVAIEDVEVAGRAVEAIKVRFGSNLGKPGDSSYGSYDNHLWFALEEPVIVKRTLDANVTTTTPVGKVSFKESFELVAQSMKPRS